MRTSPSQYSFSSGEVSPLLHGRPDYQRTQSGLRTCHGFLPLRQGGITRAPGTLYRGRTRADAAARLVAFEFAANDAVILEFSHLRMRVWRYGAPVLAGGAPYEIVTPYDATAIWRLKWVQSADVIYLVDGRGPPQRLARRALDDWTIGACVFQRGPFEAENTDEAVTIQASGETGSVTLTGAGTSFSAALVGSLISLRAPDDEAIPTWTGNTPVAAGDRMRYDGRVYQVVSGTDTGVNPPIHAGGRAKTGQAGPVWAYVSDGSGIVRVTAVAGGDSATATVIKALPPAAATAPTHRWAEGAWSGKRGYPAAVTIYDQRLVMAATPASPRTVWFSAVGGFTEFEPSVEADGSFAYDIAGVQSLNAILWLQAGSRGLHIGALGEEYSSKSSTTLEAIGPQNAVFRSDSTIGSRDAQPVSPDGKPIFIARDGQRIFELRYAFDQDANTPIELSLPSEHLGAPGFAEIAWQSAPLRLGWVRRGDGTLAVLLHDTNEDVLGWATLSLAGGFVESIAVAAGPTGAEDVVTLVVRRTVAGEVRRHVEEIALAYGVLSGAQPIAEAVHLMAARVAANAAGFTVVAGLDHLEGESVAVWTDRGELGPLVVTGGQVVLEDAVTRATVGLFDATHRVETMDIYAQLREGASLGRQKRVKAIGLRWHRTAAAELRSVEREFGQADVVSRWIDVTSPRAPYDLIEGASGVVDASVPSGYAKEVSYQMRPVGGAPMTLLGAVPIVESAGG